MSSGVGDSKFPKIVSTYLEEGKTEEALNLLSDNREEICKYAWELVAAVSGFLTEHYETYDSDLFKCCQTLINMIVEEAAPDDVLLQFIEEIETTDSGTKVLALLKPLEKVLLKIPDKKVTSLAWGFNAIKTYLNKLETPDETNLQGEERLLLDNTNTVIKITSMYNALLAFSSVLIDEWLNLNELESINERKQIIAKFLVELCGKPLVCLNMEIYEGTQPQARTIAQNLVHIFCRLVSDPFVYLHTESDFSKPTPLSLGAFYYLVLAEGMCACPKLYEHAYIFNNLLKFVTALLTLADDQFVVEKGLSLTCALLKNINKLELSYLWLDCDHPKQFSLALTNIILHNSSESVRKKGLQLFQTYLWCFEHKGRYLLMTNLLPNLTHYGLRGFVVTQFKEMLTQELQNPNELSEFYKGHKLYRLLDEFTTLKDKEASDLVDQSDQIVSTLNLLRFLIIADKEDSTGINGYIHRLEDNYFKYLKTGTELSREHYHLKIKEVNEESGKSNKSDCKISVSVSGQDLLRVPKEKKLEIMNLSLTTLDVIDSLLSRLVECIKIKTVV